MNHKNVNVTILRILFLVLVVVPLLREVIGLAV